MVGADDKPLADPSPREERERRDRALDQALDQSFPASDTPSMLRPGRNPPVDRQDQSKP